jgi:DMSO/TMAO reductase YedYZ heme-binding membrane subunit
MTAILLARYGTGEEGARMLVRATARTSFALFLAAFLASPLHSFRDRAATRWLVRNRRYLGVSFALSHTVHGAAILALVRHTEGATDATTSVAGGLAYLFLAAMVATSFDRSAAWLGPTAWRRLHRTGMYYLWFVFTFTYLGSVTHGPWPAFASGLLLAALAFRVWTARRPAGARDGPAC